MDASNDIITENGETGVILELVELMADDANRWAAQAQDLAREIGRGEGYEAGYDDGYRAGVNSVLAQLRALTNPVTYFGARGDV